MTSKGRPKSTCKSPSPAQDVPKNNNIFSVLPAQNDNGEESDECIECNTQLKTRINPFSATSVTTAFVLNARECLINPMMPFVKVKTKAFLGSVSTVELVFLE